MVGDISRAQEQANSCLPLVSLLSPLPRFLLDENTTQEVEHIGALAVDYVDAGFVCWIERRSILRAPS